jgi:hypothetical protein
MHCANLDFSKMCILPPYNNQKVHLILQGTPSVLPQVMSGVDGYSVTYEIPGNSQSATKTNFWSYTQQLFGVPLAPNIGLTGVGMTGTMQSDTSHHFWVEGIPITAFPDATPTTADPYQLTLIKAFSPTQQLIGTTQSVIPGAHEINCVSSGCHSSELNILQNHEQVPGFNINDLPILCADCHADNALGKPGVPGIDPFSEVIHKKHEFINTGTSADCYKCHPGPNTQCWRDVMHGSTGGITTCQNCHGTVKQVGESISSGREPWLEEPSCGSTNCHGANYAEEPGKLFRNSKGHGGLYCSACHGSPHAIFPTVNPRDNVQNEALQGFSGTLTDCSVCHGYMPSAPGPHGITGKAVQNVTVANAQTNCYNASGLITIAGGGSSVIVQPGGSATFIAGYRIMMLPGTHAQSGSYLHAYITTNGQYCTTPTPLAPGISSGVEPERENMESPVFKVYPNPTTGSFRVEMTGITSSSGFVAEIFGCQGEKLMSHAIHATGDNEIVLTGRPAGIYLVRLVSGNHSVTVKLLKQ